MWLLLQIGIQKKFSKVLIGLTNMEKTVAIIGGGIIGGGWAARFTLNGWDVKIYDPDVHAERKIGEVFENACRSLPGLSDVEMPEPGSVTFCKTIGEAAKSASFILEAVPERLEIKQSVYAQVESVNKTGIIASSTSGIMPSDLQSKMKYPERLIVAHPFNPVYLLPLVELVAGKKTNNKYIVQQSVGQISPIGLKETNEHTVRQGFIQPAQLKRMLAASNAADLLVSVYPNPTTDKITLAFNELVTGKVILSIYDQMGKLVMEENKEGQVELSYSLANLSLGNYFVKVNTSTKEYVTQISKQQ